jgi:outer membrane protein assembly factor BamB
MKPKPLHLAFGILALVDASAANWPQWRGPSFNGSTEEQGLPTTWDKTDNVVWVAPLPGFSGATPIIWEDHVFVTSPDAERRLLLICLDRKTGQRRWEKILATGNREVGRNNMASPSPVTDGKRVFALFATGNLAALDFKGNQLWARDLAADYRPFANMFIYGASPMLFRGKLYIQVLQRNPVPGGYAHARHEKSDRESFLLCLDPATGKNVFRQLRPSEAQGESQEAYSTPIPCESSASPEILVLGANYLTAHNPETGAEIWRCGGLNARGEKAWRIVPSPVVADGIIIACAPKRDPVFGIRDGGRGLVTGTHIAWQFKEFPSDCSTPLYYRGKLFVLDSDRRILTRLDPQTGDKMAQVNLGVREPFRASPTGADGKIYCVAEDGTAVVLSAGDELRILSTIAMGEAPVRSSIAVAHGQLFLRTARNVYCVAAGGSASAR